MATTNFVNGSTLSDDAWFNDVDALTYEGIFPSGITSVVPDATDGASLGTSSVMWSDLYLASGGVINFSNGNLQLNHSTGLLTLSGNYAVSGTQAGEVSSKIINATSGASAYTILYVQAGTANGYLYEYSQGYTTSGLDIASSTRLSAEASGGLTLSATNASAVIRFTAGGTTVRDTIYSDGTRQWPVYGAGAATFDGSGNITSVSDRRFKDRIAPLDYGLEEVLQLEPVKYGYNELSGLEREHLYGGFIAQDVEVVMPIAVGRDGKGYLTLADRPILGAVVNAMKKIDARMRELEALKDRIQ